MTAPARWRRGVLSLGLRLVVVGLLLWLVLSLVDLSTVVDLLLAIPLWVTLLGFGLGLLRALLLSVRWRILDSAGIAERAAAGGRPPLRLSQWDYFRYRLANSTFNLFLPSALGADVARAVMVASEVAEDRTRRVLVILFDRVLGIISIGILGLLAGLFAPGLAHRGAYVGAILLLDAALFMILLVGFSARTRRMAEPLFRRLGRLGARLAGLSSVLAECFDTFRRHPGHVFSALLVCLLVHLTSFFLVDIGAIALGIDLPFTTLAIMTTISWVILLIPVTIGGLGLRELSFVALLAPQGVGEAEATALSLFQFAVIVMVGIVGIPVTIFGRSPRKDESETDVQEEPSRD